MYCPLFLGSCLKDLYVTTITSLTNLLPQSEDNTWLKANVFLIVTSLSTIVIFLLSVGGKIIHYKNSKRKSHENPVTYQEMGTIRAHNDYSQTPAASHLELHPSPIPFDDVVGDDWYAKASKTTA
ncbi:uncharacterized protein LOC112560382 [Pomacea canaliculata]|uniref:uncharacterized protein LOC112560382 n=1 Tax=Pomacea canaliculata TaxID=400727 RepID=UPI000D739859|nr:uncharacterized protein LOC112560382 [Pomacea canaliculata]